jgi:hypothetical protein
MRRINKVSRSVAFFVCIGVAVGSALCQTASTPKPSDVVRFDPAWWKQANSDEQQGFIYGYLDCLQPVGAPSVSIDDLQGFISKTLASQKPSTPNAVTAAIKLSLTAMKPRKVLKGGEVYTGPHGFLDGGWWGGFEGPWPPNVTDEDRGYLEGYLECGAPPVTSQAVRRYQAVMNRHYASGKYEHDKIADVLQRLLKPPTTSPQP